MLLLVIVKNTVVGGSLLNLLQVLKSLFVLLDLVEQNLVEPFCSFHQINYFWWRVSSWFICQKSITWKWAIGVSFRHSSSVLVSVLFIIEFKLIVAHCWPFSQVLTIVRNSFTSWSWSSAMNFGWVRVSYKIAEIKRKVFLYQFSTISDVLISILNNYGTLFDHFTFLTFSVENMFDRLIDQFVWVLWMPLWKNFFKFLERQLEGVYFFL